MSGARNQSDKMKDDGETAQLGELEEELKNGIGERLRIR
jgi:hypothetical protein